MFAELFLDYYRETGDPHLFERGVVALKSAFVMMYCPENPAAKALWGKVWDFFGEEDYGFTMENYGHGGHATEAGEGIGEFTIYDWGNGAAAEARNRIFDHFGDVYVDRVRGHVFGIDSLNVALEGSRLTVSAAAGESRPVRVVTEDGASRTVDAPVTVEL